MAGQYNLLYVILGVCMGLLVLSGYRLYRQYVAGLKHNGSLHRARKHGRRQDRQTPDR